MVRNEGMLAIGFLTARDQKGKLQNRLRVVQVLCVDADRLHTILHSRIEAGKGELSLWRIIRQNRDREHIIPRQFLNKMRNASNIIGN